MTDKKGNKKTNSGIDKGKTNQEPESGVKRRSFLQSMAAATAAGSLLAYPTLSSGNSRPFTQGDVEHILPSVTHERMLIKVSFTNSRPDSPKLNVSGQLVEGVATDLDRKFFTFDVAGLRPNTRYSLQLWDSNGENVTSPWPLRTFPDPDSHPTKFRLACVSCPGGVDEFIVPSPPLPKATPQFQTLAFRQKVFQQVLASNPDALLVNGDHIYWDRDARTISGQFQGASPAAAQILGDTPFVDTDPVEGDANNEIAVKKAFGPQIADLYGVEFRSCPVFFVQDDHDYTENDEAKEEPVSVQTFPPNAFMRDVSRFTQKLYYPELFAPPGLEPGFASDLGNGLSKSYGELRYGQLVEGLIYDWMANWRDYDGRPSGDEPDGMPDNDAKFIPQEIEDWLIERTTQSTTKHSFHAPSTPVLWSAGKWAEPYPDVLVDGKLSTETHKPFWPPGWNLQQDRLLTAGSSREDRTPLWLCGDIHASGIGKILRSNDNDYSNNPIISVLPGTPGTGPLLFASFFRGVGPAPSVTVEADEVVPPKEQNGYTMIDFTRNQIRVTQYLTQTLGDIDSLSFFAREEYRKNKGSFVSRHPHE